MRDTNEQIKKAVADIRNEFETAIKNKDKSVQIVTNKSSNFATKNIAVVVAVFVSMLVVVVVYINISKKHKRKDVLTTKEDKKE